MIATSCSNDEEYDGPDPNIVGDFFQTDITIKIVDEAGENLLNKDVEGNWFDQPFEMQYKDKAYAADWQSFLQTWYGIKGAQTGKSRTFELVFYGLRCVEEKIWSSEEGWHWNEGNYLLAFGGFETDKTYSISMGFLVPGYDTPIKIDFSNTFYWKRQDAIIERTIKVDGKKVDDFPITIVLPHRE